MLNCNGLFRSDGSLHVGFHALEHILRQLQISACCLTEPHLPAHATLPLDQPYCLVTGVPTLPGPRAGRDAAIAVHRDVLPACTPLPSNEASAPGDIAACILHHGPNVPDTLICSAYAPDTSRGAQARLEFWQRLSRALSTWLRTRRGCDMVLCMDSNTWLRELDSSRQESRDADALRNLLSAFNLSLCSPPNVGTHCSGSIIDVVATSPGVQVCEYQVHPATCQPQCIVFPACAHPLSSDHCLISFALSKQSASLPPSLDDCVVRHVNWQSAMQADLAGLQNWRNLISAAAEVPVHARQPVVDMLAANLVHWLWSCASHQGCVSRGGHHQRGRRRWWTAQCHALWEARQSAFLAWRRQPTELNREAYRVARNLFAHQAKRTRRSYWQQFVGVAGLTGPRNQRAERAAARLIRREMSNGVHTTMPSSMLDPTGGHDLGVTESLNGWVHYLQAASTQNLQFDNAIQSRVSRRVRRLLSRTPWANGNLDYRFVEADLIHARQHVSLATCPGFDQIPYSCFCADWAPWNHGLLDFFNLCLCWGVIPTSWKHGVVVPLPKPGDPRRFESWRPITLLSCMSKFFERMLLPRLCAQLNPTISDAQAGFRFGADEQAWLLLETLRLRRLLPRGRRRTIVAFVDIRKAYDTVWRDGLLYKLWQRGIRGNVWRIMHAFLDGTSARARVRGRTSRLWYESNGVRQGAILSPLEFLVYLDDLNAELERACAGVALDRNGSAPRVRALFYADDIALFAESPEDLHRGLAVLDAWARRWRLTFGVGVEKSAVMDFFGSAPSGLSPFSLGGQSLPWVSEYRYLGIYVNRSLSLHPHVLHLRSRGLALFWQVCGWARREALPLPCLLRLFQSYVVPACTYGSELFCDLIPRCSAFSAVQRELGRYLLQSAHAPNAVVQGDLAWPSWDLLALERAACLLSRLQCASPDRLAARVFRFAVRVPGSWSHAVRSRLLDSGVPPPAVWGLDADMPANWRRTYMRSCVQPALRAFDVHRWQSAISQSADPALRSYSLLVPIPAVSSVHAWGIPIRFAAAWGRIRSGSSCLGAHRPARHARLSSSCLLCNAAHGDAIHCIVHCPALRAQRQLFWRVVWPAFRGRALSELLPAELLHFFFAPLQSVLRYSLACAAFAFAIERAHSVRSR